MDALCTIVLACAGLRTFEPMEAGVMLDQHDRIGTYIRHFESIVARIESYSVEEQDLLLKKNLVVSVIDAVSRSVYGSTARNRERLVGVVERFGDWPECRRVSVPH